MPRHHLVPQMYLNRFADADNQVIVVPRDDFGNPHRSAVRKAAAEVGFYEIPASDLEEHARDGHNAEVVEQALAGIEGATAVHINRILGGHFPPADLTARLRMSVFVALQYTRGWRFRRDFADTARLTAPAFIRQNLSLDRVREVLQARGRPSDDAAVSEMFERLTGVDGPKPVVRQGMFVQFAVQAAIDDIAPTIFSRRWRLLRFPRPCLLTSDEPVAVPPIEGRGLANVPALWVAARPQPRARDGASVPRLKFAAGRAAGFGRRSWSR